MTIVHGTTRTVLLVGNVAIKVPTVRNGMKGFLRGMLANLQEAEWWRYARNSSGIQDRRLAPVLWAAPLGILVVMRRAEVPRNCRKWLWRRTGELHRLFDGLPLDPNPSNFGFIGRTLVLLDYGN